VSVCYALVKRESIKQIWRSLVSRVYQLFLTLKTLKYIALITN